MASKIPAFGTINLDPIGIKSDVQARVEFRRADPRPVVANFAIVSQASRGSSVLCLNLGLVMDESINTT
jgi:hypothetical protein